MIFTVKTFNSILIYYKTVIIILMDISLIYILFIIIGLCMGSFAGASVWRLRAHQLLQDKKDGESVDKVEYNRIKKLTGKSLSSDRSVCINCSYTLKWYDMIPLLSWIFLRGKCRKCRKSIGIMEPLIELGVAGFFVLSFIFWPYSLDNGLQIVQFIIWLIAGVGLAVLFVYDAKWSLLPDKISFTVIGIGIINSILVVVSASDKLSSVTSIFFSIMILSGLYWVLHKISDGKWIGFGDIKLGLGLALLLADWRLAFIALFTANLLGCLIVIPAMATKKLNRKSHIPFGPLLIVGSIFALFVGKYLINIYFYSPF